MFTFSCLVDRPLIDTLDYPELGGNINGPSLIRVPPWVNNPLGRYYLYFAHHEGKYIRLAYANALTGPWTLHPGGTLHLKDSCYCQTAPRAEDTHPDVLAMIKSGIEGDYPHIASPDVHIDPRTQQIHMYLHGRLDDGTQQTKFASSHNGLEFSVEPELLGDSYFRVFKHYNHYYAIALGAVLYRSANGKSGFERGPALTDNNYRHGALLSLHDQIYVIWTRAEDCPERLLISRLDTSDTWRNWQLRDTQDLHKPTEDWEGADEPLVASRYGGSMSRVNQLRDPCIFQEDGNIYILYSTAGEQGLGLGCLRSA